MRKRRRTQDMLQKQGNWRAKLTEDWQIGRDACSKGYHGREEERRPAALPPKALYAELKSLGRVDET